MNIIMNTNDKASLLDNIEEMKATIKIKTRSNKIRKIVKCIEQKINRNYFLEHTYVDLIKFGFSCWKIDNDSGDIIGENFTKKCDIETVKLMDRTKVIYFIDYAENPYSLVYHNSHKPLIRGVITLFVYAALYEFGYKTDEIESMNISVSIN